MSSLLAIEISNFELSKRIAQSLSTRLSSSINYTDDEINEVTSLDHKLISKDITLDTETIERLRAASRLSRCELKQSPNFSSHRPFIGTMIALAKKLTWPFIHAQLKESFSSLEDYNLMLLETLAKQISETEKLKLSVQQHAAQE